MTTDPVPYAVFPTQPWQVCNPESGVEHIQSPAAQGGAPLGSYIYLFTRASDDQMYAQQVLIETGDSLSQPWITYLRGNPFPLVDPNGGNLCSQAPPAAIASNNLIFLVYPGATGDESMYMSRYNGTTFEPGALAFQDQSVAPSLTVCMATLDNQVFLAWPGSGYNGYFYAVGTIGAPDAFGPTIQWGTAQVIPGTQDWVQAGGNNGNPTVMAFKTDTVSGFIFFTSIPSNESPTPDTLAYFVYDNATNAFTSPQALPFPLPANSGYNSVTGCSLPASSDLVIPVLIDQVGNITSYQLDDSAPNYGSFAPWLQCAIGGGGGDIGLSVGLPPSISISGEIDSSPTPCLSARSIYPGTNGGALICGQFYYPVFGDNSLGYAGVALNVGQLLPP
jgi:hypothetical protein